MKKMKKIISFLLTGMLSFGIAFSATSCDGNVPPAGGGNEAEMYDPNKGIDFNGEKQYISTQYKIVVPDEEDKSLQYAAKELQTFISSASGCILPIVKESAASTADKIISLGDTRQAAFVSATEKALNVDGFRIVTRDDDIFIKGAHTTATMYGIYDFAEKVIGVKFLTGDYTYIPSGDSLGFYPMDITEIPTFATRHYFSGTLFRDLYNAVHMRMVSVTASGVVSDETGYDWLDRWWPHNFHSSFTLLPPAKYQAKHPDWYGGGQLCLSNGIDENGEIAKTDKETMAKEALANLKLWILENPQVTNFMVAEQDGSGLCSCTNCTASYRVNGGYSGTKLVFINALAKEIEKWAAEVCPEREIFIYTFAYGASILPPLDKDGKPVNNLVIPRKNVGVFYACGGCGLHEYGDPNCEKVMMEEKYLDDWAGLSSNLCVYDYQVNFNIFMFYLPHQARSKSQLLRYEELGVQTVMSTAAPWIADYYQGLLDTYLYSKLMWNPHRNVSEIVEEFNYYYFTAQYAELADDFVHTITNNYYVLDATLEGGFHPTHGWLSGRDECYNAKYYPIGMLKRLENNIEDAMQAITQRTDLLAEEKQTLITRLKKLIIQPQFMILWNYDDYYDSGRKEYALKFFANTDELGISHYGEHNPMSELKELYGIDT